MAGIHFTSELMNNYVSAEILPAAKHLFTCFDVESGLPMVFALIEEPGQLPALHLIRTNVEGQRVSLNLVEKLRLPATTAIQTLDVKQAASGSIFLCLATNSKERLSELHFVKPFTSIPPSALETLPSVRTGTVRSLRLGPVDVPNRTYPMVYVTGQPLDRTSLVDEVTRVDVDLDFETATLWMDVSLPVNAKVLDIASGSAGNLGEGLFYLIEQRGKRELFAKFVRPGDAPGEVGKWSTFQLPCPEGACTIESFTDFHDDWKQSVLVIGSTSGLHWIHVNDFISSQSLTPRLLSSKKALQSPKSLLVVQDRNDLSIWITSQDLELIYLVTSTRSMNDQRSSTLLPAGQATVVSPMIYKPNGNYNTRQAVVINNQLESLSLLQQSLDTGLWRSEPFYAAQARSKVVEIRSYTININVEDEESNPVVLGQIFVKPSSELPVIVNGKHSVLGSQGAWHELDLAGEIALIVPTTGVAIQPLQIEKYRDANGSDIRLPPIRIDPSRKVIDKLSGLTTAKELETAQTKDGKSIWDGIDRPSASDLKCAASCFAAIREAHAALPQDGSKMLLVSAQSMKQLSFGSSSLVNDVATIVMDGFYWVKQKVDEAVKWIVEKVGDVWQFVCEIGGNIKNFVLDCVEKVKEAATWVWEKMKLGWQKLTEFVGFIFSWDDTLETKDTVKSLLNAGLDYAEHKVEGLNTYVDRCFDNMQDDIAKFAKTATGKQPSAALARRGKEESKGDDDIAKSTPLKWVNERIKNDKAPSSNDNAGSKDDEAVSLWKDRICPLVDDIVGTAEQLGKDIAELFKNDHNMSTGDLLGHLGGNLIINVLQVLRRLIKTVVSILAKLIGGIKTLGNAKLEWGFLGSLYRWLTGNDLSIFDAVALLIAIPSTIIIKIVTGKKPPNLGVIDKTIYLNLTTEEDGKKDGPAACKKKPVKSQSYKDTATIVLGCGCGIALIKLGYDKVKFVNKLVTGKGLSGAVDSLSPATIMELISMCLDAFSVIKELLDPASPDDPGAEFKTYIMYTKCGRLAINALYMLIGKLGFQNPVTDQIKLCIDLLTAIINYNLNTMVALKGLDAPDFDEGTTAVAIADNFFETLTAVGYFTAFTFKEKEPHATAIGLVCMEVAGVGALATKSAGFRLKWKNELQ